MIRFVELVSANKNRQVLVEQLAFRNYINKRIDLNLKRNKSKKCYNWKSMTESPSSSSLLSLAPFNSAGLESVTNFRVQYYFNSIFTFAVISRHRQFDDVKSQKRRECHIWSVFSIKDMSLITSYGDYLLFSSLLTPNTFYHICTFITSYFDYVLLWTRLSGPETATFIEP